MSSYLKQLGLYGFHGSALEKIQQLKTKQARNNRVGGDAKVVRAR